MIPFDVVVWILSVVGVIGFLLIGRRVWWAWYINAVVQLIWILYWIFIAKSIGPIVGNILTILVFIQNSWRWSKEYHNNKNTKDRNKLSKFLDTGRDLR
jgi:hypothetical protein